MSGTDIGIGIGQNNPAFKGKARLGRNGNFCFLTERILLREGAANRFLMRALIGKSVINVIHLWLAGQSQRIVCDNRPCALVIFIQQVSAAVSYQSGNLVAFCQIHAHGNVGIGFGNGKRNTALQFLRRLSRNGNPNLVTPRSEINGQIIIVRILRLCRRCNAEHCRQCEKKKHDRQKLIYYFFDHLSSSLSHHYGIAVGVADNLDCIHGEVVCFHGKGFKNRTAGTYF